MSNGHIQIHDVLSNHTGPSGPSHPGSSTDPGSLEGLEGLEASVEFRVLMAYATRRRPRDGGETESGSEAPSTVETGEANGSILPPNETQGKKKKKKKKGWKRLPSIFKCIKPQTEETKVATMALPESDDDVVFRAFGDKAPERPGEDGAHDALAVVARRLTALADEIPFLPPDIETDHPEESNSREVEAMIGLLLRDAGDRLNEKVRAVPLLTFTHGRERFSFLLLQELKDANIAAELFWNYDFFRTLVDAVLTRMGLRSSDPDAPGPQASPKTQMAVACEVTTRLSAVETLPMSRLLDHGARYLQDFFSPWVRQQGGYEAAFHEDEDEVE